MVQSPALQALCAEVRGLGHASAWNLKVTVHQWLPKPLTDIASTRHFQKVPMMAALYFQGIVE